MKTPENGSPREPLAPEEAAFVERVRELSAHPGLGAAERVAFQARLDARLERTNARGWQRPLAGLAAGLAAAALVFIALPAAPPNESPQAMAGGGAFADALLSLAAEPEAQDDVLPADYAAIEGIFFDG